MNYKLLVSDVYKLLINSDYNLIVGADAPVGSGVIKRWNGSAWVEVPVVASWDNVVWDSDNGVKYYNGSGWVQVI